MNLENPKEYESCHIDDFKELFPEEKYLVQQYDLYTEDGYHLALFRIQNHTEHRGSFSSEKVPVLFLPGTCDDTLSSLFCAGPDQSFGFILADEGFDLWSGNFRGCRFSRKHKELQISQAEYWEGLTFEHRNRFDIPCFVQKVAEITHKQMAILGFSMSCLNILQCLAEPEMRGEIADHIFSYQLISPGLLLKNSTSPLPAFIKSYVERLESQGKLHGSLGNKHWNKKCLERVGTTAEDFKKRATAQVKYFDHDIDYIYWNVYAPRDEFNPSYRSYVNWNNWLQYYNDSTKDEIVIKKYDYKDRNMEIYQQEEPPRYDLGGIQEALTLYRGSSDKIFCEKDFELLVKTLKSAQVTAVTLDIFGHGGVYSCRRRENYLEVINRIRKDCPNSTEIVL